MTGSSEECEFDLLELAESMTSELRRRVRKLTPTHEDTADVLQETKIRLIQAGQVMLFPSRAVAQAYVCTVARNAAIDWRERHGRDPSRLLSPGDTSSPPSVGSDPLRDLISREELDLIAKELPPRCRQALLAYRADGKSCQQISAEMGITESTVRTHIRDAMKRLNRVLPHRRNGRGKQ